MGSSSGGNYKPGNVPVPPNVADYGSSTPFTPQWVNFLGDTNVPSTGLTPAMLKQIDSGSYMQQPTPPTTGSAGGADRGLLAEIMTRLDAMQNANRRNNPGAGSYFTGQRRQPARR